MVWQCAKQMDQACCLLQLIPTKLWPKINEDLPTMMIQVIVNSSRGTALLWTQRGQLIIGCHRWQELFKYLSLTRKIPQSGLFGRDHKVVGFQAWKLTTREETVHLPRSTHLNLIRIIQRSTIAFQRAWGFNINHQVNQRLWRRYLANTAQLKLDFAWIMNKEI